MTVWAYGDKGIVMDAIASMVPSLTCIKQGAGSRTVQSDQEALNRGLIKAIAGGERGAMHTLYARHNVRIHRFILRLTKNAPLAEDLVSEVFLNSLCVGGRLSTAYAGRLSLCISGPPSTGLRGRDSSWR